MELYRLDGVLWSSSAVPYCPVHRLEMDAWTFDDGYDAEFVHVKCAECPKAYPIPREFQQQGIYIKRKLESRKLKDIKVLNLDDEAIPLAEADARTKDGKYFVKAILTESKIGKRVVVYAGERGKQAKSQIFVEPSIKRLAFDQRDTHPSEIFSKLEATFEDGTKSSISSPKSKKRKRKR